MRKYIIGNVFGILKKPFYVTQHKNTFIGESNYDVPNDLEVTSITIQQKCPSIVGFCVPIFEIKKHKISFYHHFAVFVDSYNRCKNQNL